jgi:hypothetical protein
MFGGLLGALTSAFRSSDIVGVLLWFLHGELKNKTCQFASQEFFEKIPYTKVTSGGPLPAAGHMREQPMSSPDDGHGTNGR